MHCECKISGNAPTFRHGRIPTSDTNPNWSLFYRYFIAYHHTYHAFLRNSPNLFYLLYHHIMLSALATNIVVIIGCKKIQQPDLRDHEFRLLDDAPEPSLAAPAGDGFCAVPGSLRNLCDSENIRRIGELLLEVLSDQQAADDFIIDAAHHRCRGRLVVGVVLVPPRDSPALSLIAGFARLTEVVCSSFTCSFCKFKFFFALLISGFSFYKI